MSENLSHQSVHETARRALGYTRDVLGNGPNDYQGPFNNRGGVNVMDSADGLPEGKVFSRTAELTAYDDDDRVTASAIVETGSYKSELDETDNLVVARNKNGYEHTFSTHADRAADLVAQLAIKDIVRKNDQIVDDQVKSLQNAKDSFHGSGEK